MIQAETGEIELASGLKIGPSLTETQFLASPLARGATAVDTDAQRSGYRLTRQIIAGSTFRVTLRFVTGKLVAVELFQVNTHSKASWDEWSDEEEKQRKAGHDAWLSQILGDPPYSYAWGKIRSDDDPRGGYSSIVISYAE